MTHGDLLCTLKCLLLQSGGMGLRLRSSSHKRWLGPELSREHGSREAPCRALTEAQWNGHLLPQSPVPLASGPDGDGWPPTAAPVPVRSHAWKAPHIGASRGWG